MGSVENYCMAQGSVRQFQQEAAVPFRQYYRNPGEVLRMANQAMQTARQLAAELGPTPVSRSRPAVRGSGDEDDDIELA